MQTVCYVFRDIVKLGKQRQFANGIKVRYIEQSNLTDNLLLMPFSWESLSNKWFCGSRTTEYLYRKWTLTLTLHYICDFYIPHSPQCFAFRTVEITDISLELYFCHLEYFKCNMAE